MLMGLKLLRKGRRVIFNFFRPYCHPCSCTGQTLTEKIHFFPRNMRDNYSIYQWGYHRDEKGNNRF